MYIIYIYIYMIKYVKSQSLREYLACCGCLAALKILRFSDGFPRQVILLDDSHVGVVFLVFSDW